MRLCCSESNFDIDFHTYEFRRGWKVLLGSILGVGIGGPSLFYYPAGVFMKELERDLGMSRTALSAGMLLFTLAVAVVSPLVGSLIDKFGVRVPIATSLSALALCYVSFAFFLRSVFSFYLLNFVCALACAGSTPLSFTRAVNDWFTRARGLALGMMLMGTGLTAAMLPRVLATVINAYNWRAGYLFLSMLVVGTGPIIVWLVRLNPNKPQLGRKGSFGTAASIRTALYSSTFWMMLAAFFMLSLGISGLLIHFVPLLTDAGISRTEAASRAGLIGAAVVAGRLIVGFLVDRLFAPYVAAPVIFLSAVGCLVLAAVGVSAAPLFALAIGFAAGAEVDLIGYLTARYFPVSLYGRVYGWQFAIFATASGLGPFWVAAIHDNYGSYDLALYAAAGLLVLSAAIFLLLPRYPLDD